MYQLAYWPAADTALDVLAANPDMSEVLEAVERTLQRLADDPFDRRLRTSAFQTPELGGVSATPARKGDWYVFWQRGPDAGVLEIVLIHELSIG